MFERPVGKRLQRFSQGGDVETEVSATVALQIYGERQTI